MPSTDRCLHQSHPYTQPDDLFKQLLEQLPDPPAGSWSWKNPVLAVQIPRAKVINKTRKKPHLTPEEFEELLQLVSARQQDNSCWANLTIV